MDARRAMRSGEWDEGSLESLINTREGWIDPKIYTDETLYELELERIFSKSWLLLCHESHIKNPGDYLTTYMGNDSVVVARQKDGSIRAFLNQCSHRGMRLVRADQGQAWGFTCPYHGWAYDVSGRLVNIPHEGLYPVDVDKSQLSPLHARVATYKGLVFGTWDDAAPELHEYLGDARFYMDHMLDRSEAGTEAIGGIEKWIIKCNWKFAAEQFASDMYHVPFSHTSGILSGLPPHLDLSDVSIPREGYQFSSLAGGHGCGSYIAPGSANVIAGIMGPMVAEYYTQGRAAEAAAARLGQERASAINQHTTIFPNCSFLTGVNTVRAWHPKGPNEMEVWAFTVVDADAPEEVKEEFRRQSIRTFSAGGVFEQDDGENWVEIQRVLQGYKARQQRFLTKMGMGEINEDHPLYPGRISGVYSEEAARGFYGHWLRLMTDNSQS